MLFYLMKRTKRNMMNIEITEINVSNLIFRITLPDEKIRLKCLKSFSREISENLDSKMMRMMTTFSIQVLNFVNLGNLYHNLEGMSRKVFRRPLRLCKIKLFYLEMERKLRKQ